MSDATRRQVLHALAGLMGAGLLGVPTLAAAAGELVVTTYGGSWEKFWRATLLPAFTAKTKIDPRLDIGLGRTYTTTMRAAGVGKSPYGVVMTNEIYASVLRLRASSRSSTGRSSRTSPTCTRSRPRRPRATVPSG